MRAHNVGYADRPDRREDREDYNIAKQDADGAVPCRIHGDRRAVTLQHDEIEGEISPSARSAANVAFGQAIAQARGVLVNDPFETSEVRRSRGRRPIDAAVVAEVGRLFIPISAILDLRADPGWRELSQPMRDAICTYHQALAEWFRQAASWARSGEGADEVAAGLPEPPTLSGPGDHLTALETWYGVLHQDIRSILDEVGPQPQPVTVPAVGDALHATG